MPKKASTKKKVTKKTSSKKSEVKKVILERAENLDFNIESAEQAREIAAYLKQLETTIGWIYLKKMLQANMLVLERGIITKIDQTTQEKLTEDDIETMRRTYLVYEELVNKPAQLIVELTKGNTPTLPEYDPYPRDIRKDNTNYAGVMDDEDV